MKHILLVVMVVVVTTACVVVFLKSGEIHLPLGPPSFEDKLLLYKSKIHQVIQSGTAECTVLMPTYKREKMLPRILRHYCNKLSPLNRIVLVWNNPDTPVPLFLSEIKEKCDKELKIIPMKENKLTNRFLPQNLEEIQTECIFFVDDDLVTSWRDMKFGLLVWQKFKYHLVGYLGRTKTFSILQNGSYFYRTPRKGPAMMKAAPGSYGIMLPGFFVHKVYLRMVYDSSMVPSEYLDYIDAQLNCEDILLTMMVTKFVNNANLARSGGLAIVPQDQIKCLRMEETKGLTGRPDHFAVRSQCLQKFVQHFGNESLVLTQLVVKNNMDMPSKFVKYEVITED